MSITIRSDEVVEISLREWYPEELDILKKLYPYASRRLLQLLWEEYSASMSASWLSVNINEEDQGFFGEWLEFTFSYAFQASKKASVQR